jgi:hypothetical protein
MPWHPAQLLVAALFILGVPALACGFGLDAPILLRIGAMMLLGAALLNATQVAVIVRHAWLRPRLPAGT